MPEGPFNHVVDCSSEDGIAIDWTLTPEEARQIEAGRQQESAGAAALDKRDAAMRALLLRAADPPGDVLLVSDLRLLMECLGWWPE